MILHAFTDGASRGNPGESGIGVLVKDSEGHMLFSLHGYIGIATNNRAEYTALVTLLDRMQSVPCSRLIVHSDSELMVRQVTGRYKVRNQEIKKYFGRVTELLTLLSCDVEFAHIPRELNKEADQLANLAIETKKGLEPRVPLPSAAGQR